MPGAKRKSAAQVGYLLGGHSPLTGEQKEKLRGELRSGAVKVKKKGKRRKRR